MEENPDYLEILNVIRIAYKWNGKDIDLFVNCNDLPRQEVTKFSYNNVEIYIRGKEKNEGSHNKS